MKVSVKNNCVPHPVPHSAQYIMSHHVQSNQTALRNLRYQKPILSFNITDSYDFYLSRKK